MGYIFVFIFDLLLFVLGFALGLLALSLYGGYLFHAELWSSWWSTTGLPHLGIYLSLVVFIFLRFFTLQLYHRSRPFWDETIDISKTVLLALVLQIFVSLVTRWPVAKSVLVVNWVFVFLCLPLWHYFLKTWFLSSDEAKPTCDLIHSTSNEQSSRELISSLDSLGFRIHQSALPSQFKKGQGQNLVVALDEVDFLSHQKMIPLWSRDYRSTFILTPMAGIPLVGATIRPLFRSETLLLSFEDQLNTHLGQFLKRSLDLAGAAVGLVIFSPLFLICGILAKLSGGPAFFAHQRVGKNGKMFPCYKFRTMVVNAEQVLQELLAKDARAAAEWQKDFKLRNDPRITRIGQFLRKTSLDELPQLWNVLKGEMSLVGPRPIIEKEVAYYSDFIFDYYRTKPGITGLWQVSGRNDTSYDQRVALDSWYVRNWSIWYDLAIIFDTIRIVLLRRGAY